MKRTPLKRTLFKKKYKDRIPPAVRKAVWKRDKGRCVKCKRELLHLDLSHTVHAGMGGNSKVHTVDNIHLRCRRCHDIFDGRVEEAQEVIGNIYESPGASPSV